jgi:hypothetical protein
MSTRGFLFWKLKAGNQIKHSHQHSVPVFEEEGTAWLDRFSGTLPRLEPSEGRFTHAAERLEFASDWAELVEEQLHEVEPNPQFDPDYFRSPEGLFIPNR